MTKATIHTHASVSCLEGIDILVAINNNGLECIPDKYCESRWLKTPLVKAVHGVCDDTLPTSSVVDERVTLSNEGIVMFYGFLRRYEKDAEVLRTFLDRVKEVGVSLQSGAPSTSASEKRRMCVEYYGMERPEDVEVLPPDVVRTKGSCSDHNSRLVYQREKAIKEASRPLRKCRTCGDMVHHDSRTCPEKDPDTAKEKTREKRYGKRKS